MKNILVIGTGTIGEPLIGLLADFRKELRIGSVFFHKRTPLVDEVAKVNSMVDRGAELVVDEDKVKQFQELGHEPVLIFKAALKLADVVIDCTPAGNESKEKYYLPLVEDKKSNKKVFIAQGSEKDFGVPFAHGINDDILDKKPQFIQVVSCNTHNISSLIKTITPSINNLTYGDFTCIRRANDISQAGSFIASPEVGKHSDFRFGTHHARDTYDLFNTIRQTPNIFSSALKTNTQYMHIIRFTMQVKGSVPRERVIELFEENKFTSVTHKTLTNKVFSFGRDHGYYGRIFNHTVVSLPSLYVGQLSGETLVSGFCFTPQDGNSILSSVAAAMHALYGKKYKELMKVFDKFLFNEV
jgi:glyceraldehyde-3-phosphate dehydrogenase (NAD(P))